MQTEGKSYCPGGALEKTLAVCTSLKKQEPCFLLGTGLRPPANPSSLCLSQVFIINLLRDIKYFHFRPVMDTYIQKHFAGALAYK